MEKKRSQIKVPCAHCGKATIKFEHHVRYNKKHGYNNYCSASCKNKNKQTGAFESCANCHTLVWVTKAIRQRSKSGKCFCSRHCATVVNNRLYKSGEQHPNFTEGKASYRERAFKAYGIKCNLCNYSIKEVLEVHHIDCNRKHNDLKNLVVLCPTHHKEVQLNLTTI